MNSQKRPTNKTQMHIDLSQARWNTKRRGTFEQRGLSTKGVKGGNLTFGAPNAHDRNNGSFHSEVPALFKTWTDTRENQWKK